MEIRTCQACSIKVSSHIFVMLLNIECLIILIADGSLGFISGSFSNLTQFSGLTNNMKKVANLAYL